MRWRATLVVTLTLLGAVMAAPAARADATPNCMLVGGGGGPRDRDLKLDVAHIHSLADKLGITAYPGKSGFQSADELRTLVQRAGGEGCVRLTLFIASHGSPSGDAFCPGDPLPTLYLGRTSNDTLNSNELRDIMDGSPGLGFNLILEACHAEQFYRALVEPRPPVNLGDVVTSTGEADLSRGSRNGSPFVKWMIRGFDDVFRRPQLRNTAPTKLSGAIALAFHYQERHNPNERKHRQKSSFHAHKAQLAQYTTITINNTDPQAGRVVGVVYPTGVERCSPAYSGAKCYIDCGAGNSQCKTQVARDAYVSLLGQEARSVATGGMLESPNCLDDPSQPAGSPHKPSLDCVLRASDAESMTVTATWFRNLFGPASELPGSASPP